MLWFIRCPETEGIDTYHFKTSYVMVYLIAERHIAEDFEFQNILCYGLSEQRKGQGGGIKNFKTSY